MTPAAALTKVIRPAFALLPAAMHGPRAEAALLAIGLQESRLVFRRQIKGPARGLWQFERGGGVKGVLTHAATRDLARAVCEARGHTPTYLAVYNALEWDDVLAACFARLLLWTLPKGLPTRGQHAEGWRQYLDAWRPGEPHPETWNAFYNTAWETVDTA